MRTLAWLCGGFSAAIFAAVYLLRGAVPIYAAVLCLLLGILFAVLKKCRRLRLFAFAAVVGFSVFLLHAQFTTVEAAALDGQTIELHGEVLSFPEITEDYTRVRVRLRGVKLNTLLYVTGGSADRLFPGSVVELTATLHDASQRYGEDYQYNIARDIYLTANSKSPVRVTDAKPAVWKHLPEYIRYAITDSVDRLFPDDTRVYVKSLIINDKTELYDDAGLYTAMKKSGIMHIVSVSGMHTAFLVGFLQLLFGAGRKSAVLSVAAVWLFALVSEAPPSAFRAAFMQTVLILSVHIKRENDPITSLLLALSVLLLTNPYCAASVSLQLSFASMAGIILFAERIAERLMPYAESVRSAVLRRLLEYTVGSIASTLSVLSLTVPLCAVYFGYVSVVSPLTNLLVLWAQPICFCGAYVAALLGAIFTPLGRGAAWLLSWLVRYTAVIARTAAHIPFAVVYTSTALGIAWLVLVYILSALAVWTQGSVLKRSAYTVGLSAAALAVMLLCSSLRYKTGAEGYVSILNVGQGQCIALLNKNDSVLIDCGTSGALRNAGETAGAYLNARGRRSVDALVLTHLHADHANGVTQLFEEVTVRRLLLSDSMTDEDGLLDGILSAAEAHGVEIEYITADTVRQLGGIVLRIMAPPELGDVNERGLLIKAGIGDFDLLVTGDAPASVERALIENMDVSDTELLVVGHHGSRYSSTGDFLKAVSAETAVISVGQNSYGHPTYEVLDRLAACGYTIYRTDLNGTITIEVS